MDWYEFLKDFSAATVALFGVIVTGCFAFAGLRTFNRWKRKKLEEKRIDVAIDALAIGFEASIVFDDIRTRFARVHEYADMKIARNDQTSQQQGGPYAVLKRMEAKQPFFDKALSLEPKFVAVFGRDKDGIFELLFSARRQVIVTAETLIEDDRIGLPENAETRAQRVKWRKQIFASPGTVDPEDEVGRLLQRFRDEIEKLCRPIVNRSFKSGRRSGFFALWSSRREEE
jgi:hypothetical protein